MRVLTNPGSNLTSEDATRYGLTLLPQKIVVDGTHHDTREPIAFADIDRWVKTAKEHPFVLGTSAAECSELFRQTLKVDKRIVMLTAANSLVGTFKAATAAARSVSATMPDVSIDVIDTRTTDMGSGLATIFAAEALAAGKQQLEVVSLAERFVSLGHLVFHLARLDYMVKAGRVSGLRSWLADIMNVSPLIGFEDGVLAPVARVSRKDDVIPAIVATMEKRVRSGATVWASVVHGGNEPAAARLAEAAKKRWKIERLYVRPVAATTYLNAGPGSVGLFLTDVGDLPWRPRA